MARSISRCARFSPGVSGKRDDEPNPNIGLELKADEHCGPTDARLLYTAPGETDAAYSKSRSALEKA